MRKTGTRKALKPSREPKLLHTRLPSGMDVAHELIVRRLEKKRWDYA